ncbi:hypothetical protein BFAG_02242 [Bacteroides fragilis 3_1_12]|uniref:Uncharacterized protein n=1 Tax=Bacteroides fragilis 3_1_12 TaxID=457424 RepID=A0ABN0BL05_BACFG|nr:hypothetical protein BFAG_02242 [Bacteroides fragilis 3_1_12]
MFREILFSIGASAEVKQRLCPDRTKAPSDRDRAFVSTKQRLGFQTNCNGLNS